MVTRYYRELLNFLARSVKDRDAAADLAQESYARVLAVQNSGETIADPRALLYRTARNLMIDQHRRAEVRGEAQPSSDADGATDSMDLLNSIAAPSACEPEAAAASAQTVNALLVAVGALPLRCREAFILHKFDGLSQVEVAARMGISVKMVERHIKLGMEACWLCLRRLENAVEPTPSPTAGQTGSA